MPTPTETALLWMLGGDMESPPSSLRSAEATSDAAGVLRRLLQNFTGDPVGPDEQLALGAGVGALTVPQIALSATVNVEAQPIRIRFDGRIATAAIGLLLPVGTTMTITGRKTLKACSVFGTAAGAILNVTYWT